MYSDIVFVRTRWHYQSYTDYWKLIELAGYQSCYVDEVDVSQTYVYVVCPMNGEWMPHIDSQRNMSKRATLVLWNLERPGGSGTLHNYVSENHELIDRKYVDVVVVSDAALAAQGDFHYVPLGSDVGLGSPGAESDKEFDLIGLMCYSARRAFMFRSANELASVVGGMTMAPNGWGNERHGRLQRAKFMLNVHQDNFSFIEPLRFALAAAYGLPIITESCHDVGIYAGTHIVSADLHNLLVAAANAVSAYVSDGWYGRGMYFRQLLTGSLSFRRCLGAYL